MDVIFRKDCFYPKTRGLDAFPPPREVQETCFSRKGRAGENTESVLACVSAGNQVTLSSAGRGGDLHSEFQVRRDYKVKA